MFLHRVKMNWKRYQKLTMAILLFALARIVLETCCVLSARLRSLAKSGGR